MFPFLDLPLEVRNMIYRKIVLSQRDDTGMARLYQAYGALVPRIPKVDDPKHKLKRDDAMNLMLTSTQVRIEASQILMEERFCEASLGGEVLVAISWTMLMMSYHSIVYLQTSFYQPLETSK